MQQRGVRLCHLCTCCRRERTLFAWAVQFTESPGVRFLLDDHVNDLIGFTVNTKAVCVLKILLMNQAFDWLR